VLHSMDRDSLADALVGNSLEVFLQVNLTDDPGRGGIEPGAVQQLAERVQTTDGLTLRGLMAVAPLGVEARAVFSAVREMSEKLVEAFPAASALSIGMSGDYREAILEGATHLRIGAAITGNRPVAG
ncbi:MAG: alanine racemase, partial [Salinibacterium sp.]|nr:alanine racemase [Salinibacterium sp.]